MATSSRSVSMCDDDDGDGNCSVASAALSQAHSCPPVPMRRRAKMKKSLAPPPPAKLTSPLSLSATSLPSLHESSSLGGSGGGHQPLYLSSTSSCSPVTTGSQHVSDDCAINELLEGRMDLEVFLPDGRQVLMNVERRTPMMDLLVQVTTPNKISPGGHVIHILTDRGKDFVHYKPSTPIGSLDTNSIYIVPKSSIIDPPVKKMPKVANKPFESTFRLQVNLPRGQLTVYRVSPKLTLAEIKQMACRDKNLDHSRYQLVHPHFPNRILDLNSTLANFGATEISLMSNSNINANIRNSTSDLIAYAARSDDQDKDKKRSKGILGLFSRKKSKGSVVDSSSDSMDSRGVSPSRSDSSGPNQLTTKVVPPVPVKKRPAPPPPPRPVSAPEMATTTATVEEVEVELTNQVVVSHSRHSSDSSGYHEASLLSESPDQLHPDVCSGSASSGLSTDSMPKKSKPKLAVKLSLSDPAAVTSAAAAGKKRKAPPPPPRVVKNEPEVDDVVSSQTIELSAGEILKESSPCVEAAPSECPPAPLDALTLVHEPNVETQEAKADFDLAEEEDDEIEVEEPPEHQPQENALNRQPSLTSLGTIADIQNSFDITIAEGEKVLEEERQQTLMEESSTDPDPSPPTTKREPLVVSQQQILSRIEAAFNAVEVDEVLTPPTTAATASAVPEDDLGWEYPIPDPPPAFRNDEDEDTTPPPSPSLATIPPSMLEDNRNEDSPPPPLPSVPPPVMEDCDVVDFSTLRPRRAPLLNFTIGAYKKHEEDIFASMGKSATQTLSRPPLLKEQSVDEPLPQSNRSSFSSYETVPEYPEVKITEAKQPMGSVRGIKGQVKLICAEMTDVQPALVGRSASVLCLVPPPAPKVNGITLERSSSAVAEMRKSQSVQDLNGDDTAEMQKLHDKFLQWKKQLEDNQNVLENKVAPIFKTIPPPAVQVEDNRCQTLPRQKSKPFEVDNSVKRTFTLDRQPKVTIGSWQQREPKSLPVANSMENIRVSVNGSSAPPEVKPRPVSMYAGSWQPKIQVQMNNVNSLRTATTKTKFQPPVVRQSSLVRQRLPPEVKDDEPPSVTFKKLDPTPIVSNGNKENNSSKTVTYLNRPKESGKMPSLGLRPSFNIKPAPNVVGFKQPPPINGTDHSTSNGTNHSVTNGTSSNGVSNGVNKIVPIIKNGPPMPPPLPRELTAQLANLKSVNGASRRSKMTVLPLPKLDPREELMLEIRNFGGRVALRK